MGARDCTDMRRSLPKEHLEGDCCTSVSLNQWAQGSSPWRCTTTKSELFSDRGRVRIFLCSSENRTNPLFPPKNDPLAYADLILNGDPEEYLKNVTGSHRLEI